MKNKLSWFRDPSGCFICTSHSSKSNGYPKMQRNGTKTTIARLILLRRHGKLSFETVCRHTCDNWLCINPSHLVTGSRAENMRDMYDRHRNAQPQGEQHCRAKLTEKQVREIYGILDLTHSKIAMEFEINKSVVSRIKNRKTWKHLHNERMD